MTSLEEACAYLYRAGEGGRSPEEAGAYLYRAGEDGRSPEEAGAYLVESRRRRIMSGAIACD